MRTLTVAALAAWVGVQSAFGVLVTSRPVKVAGGGDVFAPIPEETRVKRTAIDTDVVLKAAYVADFELDGNRGKDVWKAAEPVPELVSVRGERFPHASDIRLLYSAKALYVGAVLWQPMKDLTAKWDQNDLPVYNDDGLELIFFNEGQKSDHLYHFAFNALGHYFDSRNGLRSYNVRGIESKTRRLADRWEIEIKIPYRGFFRERPFAGDVTAARIHRFMAKGHRRGSAPRLLENGNEQKKRMAKLLFLPPDKGGAEALAREAAEYRSRRTKQIADERLAKARRIFEERRAAAILYRNEKSPVFREALAALAQMKRAFADFEAGKMSEEDLLATSNGFADYVSRHAYLVWRGDLWANGDVDARPPEDAGCIRPIVLKMLGNEREQVCLELTGLLCGPRADIRFVPAGVDAQRQFLSRDAVRIYEEPFVRFEKDAITAPLVERAGNVVTLTPGATTRVWVQVDSRGVVPGTYQTKILLKPLHDESVAVREIPLVVTVAEATLPETRDWPLKTFFWGPNFYDNDEAQVLRLMHGAHVTHGWTKARLYEYGITNDAVKIRPPKGAPSFDPQVASTANELFFRTAKELGMRFVFGWGTPQDVEWFRLMDRRLTGMGFTRDDFIFKTGIRDEFAKADIPRYAEARARAAACPEKWKFQAVYLSTPPPTGATMDDIEAAGLSDTHKFWTVIRGLLKDKERGPEVIRRLRAKQCEVWSYECNLYMQTRSILSYYRLYLWEARLLGLDGAAVWCSGSPNGDPWDAKDGYDDGILWGGNAKTMVTTKRFEAFREGLEDVAYMALLEKAVNDSKTSKETAGKCRALLDARAELLNTESQARIDEWRTAAVEILSCPSSAFAPAR